MADLLDYVDENDKVLGSLPRTDIYQQKKIFRIARVLVYDKEGRMLLQKRSMNKSYGPLHWTTAVGGHVHAKETYEEAALREYQEELGTTSPLRFQNIFFCPKKFPHFMTVFTATHEGPFKPCLDEIAELRWCTIDEIKDLIATEPFLEEDLFLFSKIG